MKIVESNLEPDDSNDWRSAYKFTVDGKNAISVSDNGEPEDNILGRDLSFVYGIVNLMKQAHEAGKNGEEFEVTSEKYEWD